MKIGTKLTLLPMTTQTWTTYGQHILSCVNVKQTLMFLILLFLLGNTRFEEIGLT